MQLLPNDLCVALLAAIYRGLCVCQELCWELPHDREEGVIKLILRRRMLTLRDVTHLAKAVLQEELASGFGLRTA